MSTCLRYKLKNIEETEAAKKQLQDKRPFVGRGRTQSSIPASYSADFFQRGREYAEKLRSGTTTHPRRKEYMNMFLEQLSDLMCMCKLVQFCLESSLISLFCNLGF